LVEDVHGHTLQTVGLAVSVQGTSLTTGGAGLASSITESVVSVTALVVHTDGGAGRGVILALVTVTGACNAGHQVNGAHKLGVAHGALDVLILVNIACSTVRWAGGASLVHSLVCRSGLAEVVGALGLSSSRVCTLGAVIWALVAFAVITSSILRLTSTGGTPGARASGGPCAGVALVWALVAGAGSAVVGVTRFTAGGGAERSSGGHGARVAVGGAEVTSGL